MKYKISARSWKHDWEPESDLSKRFGIERSIHELTDSEVIESIMKFGRAEINQVSKDLRSLIFDNDYD